MPFLSFFKNKKVLITGHTGFKGSWLTSILLSLEAKIIGVSLETKKESHFELLKLKKKIIDIKCDIRNQEKLKKIINKYQPDIVFHLAAQSLVSLSYKNPIQTWTTNVIGTLNLIESLKILKKKCSAIIITSDKCYLNVEKKEGYKENDKLGGMDPYSGSKASAENVFLSEYKSFFIKSKNITLATARAGNVVGGGDWSKDRIIPDFITSIQNKKILKLRSPNSTRPWQHVLDPLFGYLKLSYALSRNVKNINGSSFNFGPKSNVNKKVIDVIKEINKKIKVGRWTIIKNNKKFHESTLLKLNSDLARKKLKWETQLKFKDTMSLTSEWYLEYIKNKKILTFEQIKKFIKNLK
ncbi:CDP-glucose 4,6-dehydratase [Pelagibacteraceae bacterium]|jgi:CDP-glucose 4,6-dehydratase|nr:CDP-glucose 4,6-dehydratase [Pelagibacteraceae bacterium]|tara:strand:- start:240 stop:1298 length:1059 start_codon:yes stop_codon:yes gene_type:complete